MSEIYFCVLCPDIPQVIFFKSKYDLENHLRGTHFKDISDEERHAIDLWIERHIRYQEVLNKTMGQTVKTIPDRNKTIYRGCPVCDRIIKVFNISSEPSPNGSNAHELLIRDINVDYSGNNVNHINPHLKYYPYECLICKKECEKSRIKTDSDPKEVENYCKTSVKPMMRRHIIDKHLKKSPLTRDDFEDEVEKSILPLKVMALERITRRQSPTPRPPEAKKRKKTRSMPGPLRTTTKMEQIRRFPPIIPIIIKSGQIVKNDNNKYIIAPIGPLPNSIPIFSSLTQPLMTSTSSNSQQFIKPEPKLDVKTENTPMDTSESERTKSSSEEELSDLEYQLMKDKSQVFGCVFCVKRIQSYDKTFDHYLIHLNIFIECKKCDQKFKTLIDFRTHNPLHNENINLLNINKFKVCRKWTENFLDLIKNKRQTLFEMTLDITQVYCPVCLMVSYVYDFQTDRVLAENETIESHIHKHLNYYPFECIDCNINEDIKTEFYLDFNAIKHLSEKHDIKNAKDFDLKQLGEYFDGTNSSISGLDLRIKQCVEIHKQMDEFYKINSYFKTKLVIK